MVIAVSIFKGGNGKTLTSINLGAAMIRLNKKVLLIDLDPQCDLTNSFGISPDLNEHVVSWILKPESFKGIVKHALGLDIIPASYNQINVEPIITSQPGWELSLKEALEAIQTKYDYIILDCPPAMGVMSALALTAADRLLIPMLADAYSYKALDKILTTMSIIKRRLNPKIELAGVLFTQHSANARTILGKNIVDSTKQQVKVMNTFIRTNQALKEAAFSKQDIFTYDVESTGSKDYMSLAKEILNK